jgi:recombinational DNA repair protein RecR
LSMKHPVTPDGRYFVVRGRLWRMANPHLSERQRSELVKRLMTARRAVRDAKASADSEAEAAAIALWTIQNASSASAARCGGGTALPTSTGTWRKTHHTPNGMPSCSGEK